MIPYYQDDRVALYHGDSLEILPTLDIKADVLLTDPPYFKVKQEEWDNQWDEASEFLSWMGDFLDRAKPLLTPQASVWVFASPEMTPNVERLVSERFRVLNSIRWVKDRGTHSRMNPSSLRSFLSPWEGVIFAEQAGEATPIARYIQSERVRAGIDRNTLDILLGNVRTANPERGTELVRRWEEGSSLPTPEAYARIQSALGAGFLPLPYEDVVRPFQVRNIKAATDVWTFERVPFRTGNHPCEKPESMLRHMIEVSSRPDDLILDPFAGSGSTLLAAARHGRRAIGIEKDERWCGHAANRLSQGVLDIFGGAA